MNTTMLVKYTNELGTLMMMMLYLANSDANVAVYPPLLGALGLPFLTGVNLSTMGEISGKMQMPEYDPNTRF